MEVGARHDGPCDPLSTDTAETCCGMGDCGPTHQVGTFFSRADDLHTRGIPHVIYTGDFLVTWSSSLHSIRPRSQVYGAFLEELPEGDGNAVDDEHCFSSTDRWSV